MKFTLIIAVGAGLAIAGMFVAASCSRQAAPPTTMSQITDDMLPFGSVEHYQIVDGALVLKDGVKLSDLPMSVAGSKKASACGDSCSATAWDILITNKTPFFIPFSSCSGSQLAPPVSEQYFDCEDRLKLTPEALALFQCGPIVNGVYANPDCILFRGPLKTLPGGKVVVNWIFYGCGQGG